MNKKERVGIMGGTFDPPHIGHLMLGEIARVQFDLDHILYIPAGKPPHKRNRAGRATDRQRIDMVRLAIQSNPHFEISLYEMERDTLSYTYQTLEAMHAISPDKELFFIIGEDSLVDFDTWKCPERITAAATLLVAGRVRSIEEQEKAQENLLRLLQKRSEQYGGSFLPMDAPRIEIASSDIRDRVQCGQSIRYFVPENVIEYIESEGIYKDGR